MKTADQRVQYTLLGFVLAILCLVILRLLAPGLWADLLAPSVEICDNGIDDDGNGFIDMADPACFPQYESICNNNIDDDADALVDMDDPDCAGYSEPSFSSAG